jgi:hypothetical protein
MRADRLLYVPPTEVSDHATRRESGRARKPLASVARVAPRSQPLPTRAAARAPKRSSPARVRPRGGGSGAGLNAKESAQGALQNGQRASVRRMWRAQEGQARRRADMGAVCDEVRAGAMVSLTPSVLATSRGSDERWSCAHERGMKRNALRVFLASPRRTERRHDQNAI